MLQIYNSLTRQKEVFTPLVAGQVNMYVCGITVYDYCHVGHARTFVNFDMIARYLRWSGYQVRLVRNITDIDDKIIQRALQNGETITQLTERFITAMHEDCQRLGIEPPAAEPRAIEHIPHIIKLIEQLIANGYAYIAGNGDVNYAVNRFVEYGKLANRKLEQLRAGARVDVVDSKHGPLDFVLWKLAKPGEPSWDSPWGKGRPGWHIECSAMSMNCLPMPIDIHGGGMDLLFPHHENEIAQSEGASGKKLANYWMHVGFLQINKEKMSKSLNNFFTIREVLDKFSPEVLRYFMSTGHYRSPLNYSEESLVQAHQSLQRLYTALRGLPVEIADPKVGSDYQQRFKLAMDDDFNSAEALAVLFDLAKEINRVRDSDIADATQLAAILRQLGGIFGILQQNAEQFLQTDLAGARDAEADKIEALIAARNQARHARNWQEADRLRQELAAMKVVLEDKPEGTIWRRER